MIAYAVFILLFDVSLCAETVKYAAVIYRHGDRTPVDTYPNDPYRNESLWPVKFGELTNTGKRQHYALGQWLRKRYSHLLSNEFDPTEIYIRSTDVDRTLMSAQANLAGMYPPIGRSIWDQELMWQPIPVHTVPEAYDELLSMLRPCDAYTNEKEAYVSSEAYKNLLRKYQPVMDYLSAYSGMKIKNLDDILDIYTTLKIEKLYNFTLPNWTKVVFPDKMSEPSGTSFAIDTATPKMARLKIGPLMKQILSNMFKVMNSNKRKELKLSIYSGHDLTIGNVLNGLGMYDGVCPEYTATIFLELIYDNTTLSHYVMISYRNSSEIVEPHVLSIPYCGQKCPVARFIKLYDNLLSVNWEQECNTKFTSLLGLSFFIGLGLFIIIFVSLKINYVRMSRELWFNSGYSNVQAMVVPSKEPLQE